MARTATRFTCTACGEQTPKWEGRCPSCEAWGTIQEDAPHVTRAGRSGPSKARESIALADVSADEAVRIPSGLGELDRVLGGGIVPGSLVLLGGEPGVGKSTLLTMALAAIAQRETALLVTGEESAAQVRLRAERIGGAGQIRVVAETDLNVVVATIAQEKPAVCVVDSVQTLWTADLASAPGSVSQVREAAGELLRVAKEHGVAIVLVGHVTKDGAVAGPKVLEHLVDAVLLFEGERGGELRVLRAAKNRFGATSELGVFAMTGRGLEPVEDPSALLGRDELGATGSVVACTMEGSRPLLLEVQALVSPSELPQPRRLANGIDRNRLAMLLAVLSRHAALGLGSADVFANVVGGVRVDDPAVDLAVALAVASAARGVPTGPIVAIGELGLTGRLRPVGQVERRLQEAARLGIEQAIVPPGAPSVPGIVVRTAGSIGEALALALGSD
jgi:DNA repair protein RadA/Sms